MPRYSLAYKFPLFCQLVFLLPILLNVFQLFSLNMHIKSASAFKKLQSGYCITRKLPIGTAHYKTIRGNIIFVYSCVVVGAFTTLLTWKHLTIISETPMILGKQMLVQFSTIRLFYRQLSEDGTLSLKNLETRQLSPLSKIGLINTPLLHRSTITPEIDTHKFCTLV